MPQASRWERIAYFAAIFALHAASPAQATFLVTQAPGSSLIRIDAGKAGTHRLEIDDAPSFRTPVLSRAFRGKAIDVDIDAAGLIPGLPYYFRLDGAVTQDVRLAYAALQLPGVNCANLHNTWTLEGRNTLGAALSGMRWESSRWAIKPHTFLLGESLYNAELILRPAIAAARACNDLETLDQIAQYFLVMLQQTEKVKDILSRPRVTAETRNRFATSNPEDRTFSATFGGEAGEGELYNSQWIHPAALLVRLVTLLEPAQRTPAMTQFAAAYTGFIVKEQLLRYLFEETMPPLGGASAIGRVGRWEQAMAGKKGRVPWESTVSDIDLWWLASAAEMLGANANDPRLIAIDAPSLAQLHTAIDTGLRFIQSERTLHPETKDFNGKTVGSATYFEGDDATDADMLYSAVGGPGLPSQTQRNGLAKVSWDSSHIYRLAVCFRALYENRKALGNSALQFRDLQLIANQYVYKVFNGDFVRPLFRNYFDGSDGWFRVDYNVGNPPSAFCDMRNPKRLCLMPGEVLGWPELAFTNPDLQHLEQALIELALPGNEDARDFVDRHYFWSAPYRIATENGSQVYGGMLYFAVAENAEMLAAPVAASLEP
jgi:hypothetical protein